MKNKFLFIILFGAIVSAQNNTTPLKSYDFIVYDGSKMVTMYQFNQNYLSGYRIFSRTLNEVLPNKKVNQLIRAVFTGFLGVPLTHEEGHRSILTHQGIGSISQPFFNSKGAAYVKGVTDATLINFKNNYFSNYIRLHTAGLESDYALTSKIENILFFKEDSFEILKEEYHLRKLGIIFYHFTTFIPSLSPNLKEVDNELERDIVGHDIWGMVRHLHRPKMNFYRYTSYDDLTREEKKYAKNLAWKSFTNLINPMLFGKIRFKITERLNANASINHSLAPFGDFLEQNFWIDYSGHNISFYIREYMNKNHLFLAGGVTLHHLKINNSICASVSIDVWEQPKNLEFNTSIRQMGANGNIKLNYYFFKNNSKIIKEIGLYSDIYYKSEGFIPEYASLKNDFGIRFGLSISY